MSTAPTPPTDSHRIQTDEPASAKRIGEWRTRLDAFATAFDEEMSQILRTLSMMSFDEVAPTSESGSNCSRTMEFTLPPQTPATPAASGLSAEATTSPAAGSTSAAECNRLAALKEKLSKQMASTGQSHTAPLRTAEGGRS